MHNMYAKNSAAGNTVRNDTGRVCRQSHHVPVVIPGPVAHRAGCREHHRFTERLNAAPSVANHAQSGESIDDGRRRRLLHRGIRRWMGESSGSSSASKLVCAYICCCGAPGLTSARKGACTTRQWFAKTTQNPRYDGHVVYGDQKPYRRRVGSIEIP